MPPPPKAAPRSGRPRSRNTARPAARTGVPKRLRVMISSRCNDPVPGHPARCLSDLRRTIKDDLERASLLGWAPFEVWINEDEPAQPGDRDAFQHCVDQAARAEVVLALVNGDAGWSAERDGIGICHAELKRALDVAPARVRVVELPRVPPAREKDRAFQAWLDGQRLWTRKASGFDEALAHARAAVVDALAGLAVEGGRAPRRGYDSGDALEWSRLGYDARAARMVAEASAAALARKGTREAGGGVVAAIAGREVLLRFHAVPGPMGEPAARERVGHPFLRDHEAAEALAGLAGPVHVVACHRGVTEAQAAKVLGFPDAVLVTAPFGVWAADPIQKAQLLFLASCRDGTSTRIAVQRAFEWLEASGEGELLAERAGARARIVVAVAREQEAGPVVVRGAARRARREP
jgi:hypothetical protein